MEKYIYNISEVPFFREKLIYKDDILVSRTGDEVMEYFMAHGKKPLIINAFSHILIMSGRAVLTLDGKQTEVSSGDMVILTPLYLAFFQEISEDFSCMNLCTGKSFIDFMTDSDIMAFRLANAVNRLSSPVIHLSENEYGYILESIREIGEQMKREGHLYYKGLIQNALCKHFLELLDILEKRLSTSSPDIEDRHKSMVNMFFSLLSENFKTEHKVPFYAGKMNVTPQYLTSIVKGTTGRTVSDFIYEMLYNEARRLLFLNEMTVTQIAAELDFSDTASFSKFFKRHSGFSPAIFQKESRT